MTFTAKSVKRRSVDTSSQLVYKFGDWGRPKLCKQSDIVSNGESICTPLPGLKLLSDIERSPCTLAFVRIFLIEVLDEITFCNTTLVNVVTMGELKRASE
jgi:hypothetical protein